MRRQASAQANIVAANAAGQDPTRLQTIAVTSARDVRGRVVIVDRNGVVVADSAGPASVGTSYAGRPEIATALRGRTFQAERRSDTLNEEILATAVPILDEGKRAGAVRVTQSVQAVSDSVRSSWLGLVLVAVVVLLIGLAAGIAIARRLSAPLRDLESTAGRIAAGDLERRAPVAGTAEQR